MEATMKTAVSPNQDLSPGAQTPPAVSCEVVTEGLSFMAKIVAFKKNRLRVILPTPLFARPDATTVILTNLDGASLSIAGCVISQQQIGVGEMLTVIQLATLPGESAMAPHERRVVATLRHIHRTPGRSPWTGQCLDWAHDLAGYVLAPFQDRRIIPRLAIRTNCAILSTDTPTQGMTRDLSYSGVSVLFPNFSDENLLGALLRIKFVTLKATAVDITRQGRKALVRFRIESIHEGERRWRDLHYSYWQHLS
jgi:hypothetical protein